MERRAEYLKVLTEARTGGSVPLETGLRSVEAISLLPGADPYRAGALLAVLRRVVAEGTVTGTRVFDARIAATSIAHGVHELSTADRQFDRFPDLRTRNPLVG